MRRYVIATHGHMASGINSTLEIIIGKQDNLTCIDAYIDECQNPTEEFEKIIGEYPDDDIVIMTDMMGGSVNNSAVVLTENPKVHVVAGVNLALVISLLMSDPDADTKEVIQEAIESAKQMIMYCNELESDAEDDEF